jgi:hypothetical protein
MTIQSQNLNVNRPPGIPRHRWKAGIEIDVKDIDVRLGASFVCLAT